MHPNEINLLELGDKKAALDAEAQKLGKNYSAALKEQLKRQQRIFEIS
jgi:hypothetical protein